MQLHAVDSNPGDRSCENSTRYHRATALFEKRVMLTIYDNRCIRVTEVFGKFLVANTVAVRKRS